MSQVADDLALLWSTSPLKAGGAALRRLEQLSLERDEISAHWEKFTKMLEHDNSYIRTRGLVLTARNARWMEADQVKAILEKYLACVTDPKPITARRCIQELPFLLEGRPDLTERVEQRLRTADFTAYPDSMAPLVTKDTLEVLAWIDQSLKQNG